MYTSHRASATVVVGKLERYHISTIIFDRVTIEIQIANYKIVISVYLTFFRRVFQKRKSIDGPTESKTLSVKVLHLKNGSWFLAEKFFTDWGRRKVKWNNIRNLKIRTTLWHKFRLLLLKPDDNIRKYKLFLIWKFMLFFFTRIYKLWNIVSLLGLKPTVNICIIVATT